jgi:hypothetical protein
MKYPMTVVLGLGRLILAGLLTLLLALRSDAQTFENLGANYEKLRGINFVANYPSLNSLIANPAAPFPYYGVASPTAMWKFYDPAGPTAAAVAQQLDWVKRTGFNAVRVFLSYPAWLHYRENPPVGTTGNAFVKRFKHFVGLCHARGIRVMPVLWDGVAVHAAENATVCAIHPDYDDPIGDIPAASSPNQASNISYWHRNPGEPKMTEILSQDVPFELSEAGLYIQECISVFHDPVQDYSQALLMWDVMNEGRCGDLVTWITESLRTIKFYAPGDTTTWGWSVTDQVPASITLATLGDCDVINLHAYNHRFSAVASQLYDASFITGHSTFPIPYGKPLIFTEIAAPALAYSYQDAITYCSTVPRHGTIGPVGVGFMPWQFSIGYRNNAVSPAISDHMPFIEAAGLFYADGEVRDLSVVQAFVQLAINHGIATGLWGQGSTPWPVQKSPLHPNYVRSSTLMFLDKEFDQEGLMTNTWIYSLPGVWTWQNYLDVSEMFRVLVDLGVWPAFTSLQNNNPWAWPTSTIPGHVPFSGQLLSYRHQSEAGSPAWWTMIAQLEQLYAPSLPAGWLKPWEASPANPNQQLHIDLLVHGFLRLFAMESNVYLGPR